MPAPPVIADLVERFEQQGDAYKSGQYNEAQLRKEFVDPMFKALGWDMENISGYAEAYKDVIHEYQDRRASGVSTATLRVVSQIAAQYPHRFRRVRGLRLPRRAALRRQSFSRAHPLSQFSRIRFALG